MHLIRHNRLCLTV